jgi:DNA (cytosine-5)-methyltransferase 1
MPNARSLSVVGLFAGIGGIEVGLHEAGHETKLLCEVEPTAQAVLRTHFSKVSLAGDVRELDSLPPADLVCAGFPCQDLSQAGRTAGIKGRNSGLVTEVFRLLDKGSPEWICFENVPFMLQLDRGEAMRYLTHQLDKRGYTWAYRIVDTRAFGLPQRRKRVIMLASQVNDPRTVLFADDAGPDGPRDQSQVACGFYWTEGIRGLGWAVDAIPTLKGGSTIGIPSPPAICLPDGEGLVVPEIRDAERLQGFEADWTLPAEEMGFRKGLRWKVVGNAVSVPVSRWLGDRLASPGGYDGRADVIVDGAWPSAAWGTSGRAFAAPLSQWPVRMPRPHLIDFLQFPTAPLSERATAGFLKRTSRSSLRFPEGFLRDVATHLERMVELKDRQLALLQ